MNTLKWNTPNCLLRCARTLALSLLVLAAVSCETDVENPAWPDDPDLIVVTAKIVVDREDSLVVTAFVHKTLSLQAVHSARDSYIPDADLRLVDDAGRDDPIPHTVDDRYDARLPIGAARPLTLVLRWKGKRATAILNPFEIDRRKMLPDSFRVVYDTSSDGGQIFIRAFPTLYYPRLIPERRLYAWKVIRYTPTDSSVYYKYSASRTLYEANVDPVAWTFRFSMPVEKIRVHAKIYSPEYIHYMEERWDESDADYMNYAEEGKTKNFNVRGDGIGYVWYEIEGPAYEIRF